MKARIIILSIAALLIGTISYGKGFPKIKQHGKIAVVSHRGYWDNPRTQKSENSLASLRLSDEFGFWGSELDVRLTKDNKLIVWHDDDFHRINGPKGAVSSLTYDQISNLRLPNGEKVPTLDEYLAAAKKLKKTVLVFELKTHKTKEQEAYLVQESLKALKKYGLLKKNKVIFISFSKYICDLVAQQAPKFVNQYLTGNIAPADLAKDGINGIDYDYGYLRRNPTWIKEAHDLGMSVNVWTVNNEEDIKYFINEGVDAITTNNPELVRKLLGDREYKK